MKRVEFAERVDPDLVARGGTTSGSTLFALLSLSAQYGIAWRIYFINFADINFVVCVLVHQGFKVFLFFDRRLIYTTDPQWPSITVSGTLPQLTVHVNEHKVCSFKLRC